MAPPAPGHTTGSAASNQKYVTCFDWLKYILLGVVHFPFRHSKSASISNVYNSQIFLVVTCGISCYVRTKNEGRHFLPHYFSGSLAEAGALEKQLRRANDLKLNVVQQHPRSPLLVALVQSPCPPSKSVLLVWNDRFMLVVPFSAIASPREVYAKNSTCSVGVKKQRQETLAPNHMGRQN